MNSYERQRNEIKQLADARSKYLKEGGPGSGRRPGFGNDVRKNLAKKMQMNYIKSVGLDYQADNALPPFHPANHLVGKMKSDADRHYKLYQKLLKMGRAVMHAKTDDPVKIGKAIKKAIKNPYNVGKYAQLPLD